MWKVKFIRTWAPYLFHLSPPQLIIRATNFSCFLLHSRMLPQQLIHRKWDRTAEHNVFWCFQTDFLETIFKNVFRAWLYARGNHTSALQCLLALLGLFHSCFRQLGTLIIYLPVYESADSISSKTGSEVRTDIPWLLLS